MSKLSDLKASILEDGVIDADEVKEISALIYDDGTIDQEEADFLFELNDAVSGKDNDASWNALFVQGISDYLLKDEESPGEIDAEEATWLIEKIGADGNVDGVEKELLNKLKKEAKSFPDSLKVLM